MDHPLGRRIGNALEVVECLDTLKGRGPSDLEALSVSLAARMVVLAGLAATLDEATGRVREALTSGAGLERFRRVIERQGGDPRVVDDYARLPRAPFEHVVTAGRDGVLVGLDAERLGHASNALGAGRERVEALVDSAVGISLEAVPGDAVRVGQAVLVLHYRNGARLDRALDLATRAVAIGDGPAPTSPLVIATIGGHEADGSRSA
jgi:thymidine phosphorylase